MVLFRCCTASSYASSSWAGDVHPTYSGEELSRIKSQGSQQVFYAHSRTLSLFPSNRGGFDAPQSFFHASMEFHWIIFARVPISSPR